MASTQLERAESIVAEPTGEDLLAAQRRHHDADAGPAANISSTERWWSLAGGAALTALGLARGKAGGLLMAGMGAGLLYRGWTRHCYCYEALGLNTAEHAQATAVPAQEGQRVEQAVTINRPVEVLYAHWRNLGNLPSIMQHVKSVDAVDGGRWRWKADAPFGRTIEWDAEIITERENEIIAWRSLEGSEVDTAGSVRFTPVPHDRGTVVRVNLKYNPPGGKLGAAVASLFGRGLPSELSEDLARFKSIMEAGEAPTTEGQPRGCV